MNEKLFTGILLLLKVDRQLNLFPSGGNVFVENDFCGFCVARSQRDNRNFHESDLVCAEFHHIDTL